MSWSTFIFTFWDSFAVEYRLALNLRSFCLSISGLGLEACATKSGLWSTFWEKKNFLETLKGTIWIFNLLPRHGTKIRLGKCGVAEYIHILWCVTLYCRPFLMLSCLVLWLDLTNGKLLNIIQSERKTACMFGLHSLCFSVLVIRTNSSWFLEAMVIRAELF